MSGRFDSFHVVLVEPAESLNVGMTARAMRNLGFRNLHLVAPERYSRERAAITACWGEPLLDTLIIHETFEEAIDGMEEVVGLSLRKGRNTTHFVTLPVWADELPQREPHKTALVFGPEDNGLRQEHLDHCRRVIRIPSAEECPTFNLAQSVLLTLYELTKTFPEELAPSVPDFSALVEKADQTANSPDLPTWNDYFQLDRILDSVMAGTGFVRPGSPAPVPGMVRNLFRRIDLTQHEMGIVLSLFNRINTTLERRGATIEDSDISIG